MIRPTLIAITLSAPAYAQDYTLREMEGAWKAVVIHNDENDARNSTITIDTDFGPVVLRYTFTPNDQPNNADFVEVIDKPDGVVVEPPFLEIEEGKDGVMVIREFLGG